MAAVRRIWDVSDRPTTPLGHVTISVGSIAKDLTDGGANTIPVDAKRAIVRSLGQPINWRDDGSAPTATTGFPLLADESLVYDGDPALFQMIQSSAASGAADVRVAYYGD